MLLGDDRAELRPGEQLVGGNSPRAHLSMLFGVVGHSLGKFFSMGEEEVQIKGTRLIKHLCRHFQIGALAGIGSPFFTSSEIEKEFGGTGCLPHQIEPLLRTKVRLCLEHTDLGHVCQAFWRVASSFLSVAIAEMFGTALQGRSSARQELAETPLPLQAKLAVVPCRGGEELLRRLFEPLGYTVTAAPHMLDEQLLLATPYRIVDVTDPASIEEGVHWWQELTGRGGEGMVVKPFDFIAKGRHGIVQPAVKCRGPEYLRIIYGPEYTIPEHLERLRVRGLGAKRSLALREFALGIEALERFVRSEPLRRVHECVFGVLALESEPVDPRL